MRRSALLILVILAIACRLVYALPHCQARVANPERGNEMEHAALNLARKGELADPYIYPTGPTAHPSPLYSGLLALIYTFLDPNTLTAKILQCLIASSAIAATLACLPGLARRLGLPETPAWITAFALAVLPFNFFYESFGDWESPLAGLVMILLLQCFIDLRQSSWQRLRLVAGTGLLTGIAALLSPSLVPAVALMLLAEFTWPTAPRRRVFAGGTCIVALSLVIAAPWMVRNYYALGGFVPLRSNFGLEIAMGNHPTSTGSSNFDYEKDPKFLLNLRHPYASPDECRIVQEMGEFAYMKSRQAEAFAWIRENPGRFAELTVRRFGMFWFPGRPMFYTFTLMTIVKMTFFGAISALMFLGLARLIRLRHSAAGLLLATLVGATFIYMITHVELRYRLPVHALSSLLAVDFAWALVLGSWRLFRGQREGGDVREGLRHEQPAV